MSRDNDVLRDILGSVDDVELRIGGVRIHLTRDTLDKTGQSRLQLLQKQRAEAQEILQRLDDEIEREGNGGQ